MWTMASLLESTQPLPPAPTFPQSAPPPSPSTGVLLVPLGIGVLVLALHAWLAVRSWKRGHKLLFAIGFVVPLAWWAGALLPPPKPGAII